MKEQRKEERKRLIAFTPVFDQKKGRVMGYLADLTLKGAMVVGEELVEVGQELTLGIEFPETSVTPPTRVVLNARIAWCRKEEQGQYYNSGVRFLRLTSQDKGVI